MKNDISRERKNKISIGILTYHRAYNYGAFLQACALCNRLNMEEDIDAEIIDYWTKKEEYFYNTQYYPLTRKIKQTIRGKYAYKRALGANFRNAVNLPVMKKSRDQLNSDSISEFNQFVQGKYDVIVVGSDEVWKTTNIRGFPNAYWLIGDQGSRKFAYAVSARIQFDKKMNPEQMDQIREAVNQFDFISARDQVTYEEICKIVRRDIPTEICCDPSFLYDFELKGIAGIDRIKKNRQFREDKQSILVMTEDEQVAKVIHSNLKRRYNLIAVHAPHKGYININDLNPLEWLCCIRDCDYIISSYYHAICFSIVFNKAFFAVGADHKASKIEDLLAGTELSKYYLPKVDQLTDMNALIQQRSPENNYSSFVSRKRESFQVFLNALRKA